MVGEKSGKSMEKRRLKFENYIIAIAAAAAAPIGSTVE